MFPLNERQASVHYSRMDLNHQLSRAQERFRGIALLELATFAFWLMGILFFYLPLPHPPSEAAPELSTQTELFADGLTLVIAVAATLTIFYLLRRRHFLAPIVSVLMGSMIFTTASAFTSVAIGAAIAALLVYLERAYRSFLTNNLLVYLAVFAGAIPFALSYSADFLLTLLWIFSVYDVIGVFMTRMIPRVAFAAVDTGIPLLIAAPKSGHAWHEKPEMKNAAAIMGAGDLFLPLLFLMAVSVQFGITRAFAAFAGVIIGSFINLHIAIRFNLGIPAMPFLAAGLAAGYLLAK